MSGATQGSVARNIKIGEQGECIVPEMVGRCRRKDGSLGRDGTLGDFGDLA